MQAAAAAKNAKAVPMQSSAGKMVLAQKQPKQQVGNELQPKD